MIPQRQRPRKENRPLPEGEDAVGVEEGEPEEVLVVDVVAVVVTVGEGLEALREDVTCNTCIKAIIFSLSCMYQQKPC